MIRLELSITVYNLQATRFSLNYCTYKVSFKPIKNCPCKVSLGQIKVIEMFTGTHMITSIQPQLQRECILLFRCKLE